MALIVGNGVLPFQVVSGIDGKAVAATGILTVPSGRTAIIEGVLVRCTAATAISTPPTAQVEVSGGSPGDVFASDLLTNVLVAGDTWWFGARGKGRTLPASSVVNFNITTGAVGTSMALSVEPVGFFV